MRLIEQFGDVPTHIARGICSNVAFLPEDLLLGRSSGSGGGNGGGFGGFGFVDAAGVFSAASDKNQTFWDGIRSVVGPLFSDNYGTDASSAATDNGIGPSLFGNFGDFLSSTFYDARNSGKTTSTSKLNPLWFVFALVVLAVILSGGKRKKGKA